MQRLLAGGHGPVFDIAFDKDSIALLEKFWAEGKVVAAVCHGPAGLINVKTPSGEPIVKGKKVSTCPDWALQLIRCLLSEVAEIASLAALSTLFELPHSPQVTGFTNTEEEAVGKTKKVPYLLETKFVELGGNFERSPDWVSTKCVFV